MTVLAVNNSMMFKLLNKQNNASITNEAKNSIRKQAKIFDGNKVLTKKVANIDGIIFSLSLDIKMADTKLDEFKTEKNSILADDIDKLAKLNDSIEKFIAYKKDLKNQLENFNTEKTKLKKEKELKNKFKNETNLICTQETRQLIGSFLV